MVVIFYKIPLQYLSFPSWCESDAENTFLFITDLFNEAELSLLSLLLLR
jgi:hypothetical protein